jgi:hypothetical protein
MLKLVALVCVTVALVGLPIYAQNPDPPAGQASPAAMTGTVKSFDPGKSIDVEVNGVSHKYDLSKTDTSYTINPEVKPGSDVTVMETTNPTGNKEVRIELAPPRKG